MPTMNVGEDVSSLVVFAVNCPRCCRRQSLLNLSRGEGYGRALITHSQNRSQDWKTAGGPSSIFSLMVEASFAARPVILFRSVMRHMEQGMSGLQRPVGVDHQSAGNNESRYLPRYLGTYWAIQGVQASKPPTN
jgi:hypothetical protein